MTRSGSASIPATPGVTEPCSPRLSMMGSGACLLDAAGTVFDPSVQMRVWATAGAALDIEGVLEAVPGMNNLMLVFDPLRVEAAALRRLLLAAWDRAEPRSLAGRVIEIPVAYGGEDGEDLAELGARTGLGVEEVVRRHCSATYTVAAVGAMPGFPYLSGLDPTLAWPRRASPRLDVPEGAVIIGGAQAGIMPCAAPSGWHMIGRTSVKLFDPGAAPPAFLRPGDTVRFVGTGPAA